MVCVSLWASVDIRPTQIQTRQKAQHQEGKVDAKSQPNQKDLQWMPPGKGESVLSLDLSTILQGRLHPAAMFWFVHFFFVLEGFFFFCY